MRQPWTVDLANLADHAIPLGAAINRWLWRHSPWHRGFAQWQSAMEWQRLAFDLEREIELCGERLARDLSVTAPFEATITENVFAMAYDLAVRPVFVRLTEWRHARSDHRAYPDIVAHTARVVGRNFADQVEAAVRKAMLAETADAETPLQRARVISRGARRSA